MEHSQNGQRNYVTLFLSAITLGTIATFQRAGAGFSCASGKINDRQFQYARQSHHAMMN